MKKILTTILTLTILCTLASCTSLGRISSGLLTALSGESLKSGPPPASELTKVAFSQNTFNATGLGTSRGYQGYHTWTKPTSVFGVMQDVHHMGLSLKGLTRAEYDDLRQKTDAAIKTEDYRYLDNTDGTLHYYANHNNGQNAIAMCYYTKPSDSWKEGDLLVFLFSAPWDFTTFDKEYYKTTPDQQTAPPRSRRTRTPQP